MSQVTVIDYGAGNLLSVMRALEHIGAAPQVTRDPAAVAKAERLILPGVGAFGDCMTALKDMGMVPAIKNYIASGKFFLGICVGMQVMFEVGEEFGQHEGLGIIPGHVTKIPPTGADGTPHKVPHIGWSSLFRPAGMDSWRGTVLEDMKSGESAVYFVHSYRGMPVTADQLANIDYNGVVISAAVRRGNAYGVQFHPEKSGEAGLAVLRRFLAL